MLSRSGPASAHRCIGSAPSRSARAPRTAIHCGLQNADLPASFHLVAGRNPRRRPSLERYPAIGTLGVID